MLRLLLMKRIIRPAIRSCERLQRVAVFHTNSFRRVSLLYAVGAKWMAATQFFRFRVLLPLVIARRMEYFTPPPHHPTLDDTLKANLVELSKQPSVDSTLKLLQDCAGQLEIAWEAYRILTNSGLAPTIDVIATLAKACVEAWQPQRAVPILWDELTKFSIPPDENCLLWLASACATAGDHDTAVKIFTAAKESQPNMLLNPDISTPLCQAFRAGCKLDSALELLQLVEQTTTKPSLQLYTFIFSMCGIARNLQEGKRLHNQLLAKQTQLNSYIITSLITMYSRCGSLEDAVSVFQNYIESSPNEVPVWNAMLASYRHHKQADTVYHMFNEMIAKGVLPDATTGSVVFDALRNAGADAVVLDKIKHVHKILQQHKIKLNKYIASALITCYSKCGCLRDAEEVFEAYMPCDKEDIAVWNAMINGYGIHRRFKQAIATFTSLVQYGIQPDAITMTAILNACSKSGRADEALSIFRSMKAKYGVEPNVKHASCVGVALVNAERYKELLQFLDQLSEVDEHVVSYILTNCKNAKVVDRAYSLVQQHRIPLFPPVVAALIDTYANSGALDKAVNVFETYKQTHGDTALWTAVIDAYVINSQPDKALDMFHRMIQAGFQPNDITMTAVLNACAKARLVDDALAIYDSMERLLGIQPNETHRSIIQYILLNAERTEGVKRFTPNNTR